MLQRFKLLLYPAAEILFFLLTLACLASNPWLSAGLLLLAAIALNFSLHISFHYQVHFRSGSALINWLLDTACTLLMGISFQYYRMGHWNHHRYDNRLGDFTSTWQEKHGQPVPRNIFAYAFLWPAGALRLKAQTDQAYREGYLTKKAMLQMHLENLLLALFIGALFYLNILFGIGYLVLVYLGWVLISLHNYGQHLPETYGQPKAYSYYDKMYNWLFFRNGWHLEHHSKPNLRYWHLQPEKSQAILRHPHLMAGWYLRKKPEKSSHDPAKDLI